MSKGEKKYFRKHSLLYKGKDKNSYLKLFDLIDRQKEYDEVALKKKLQGTSLAQHFAESKYYLHQLILKSLNNFYSDFSVDSQLRQTVESIKIMYTRGLFEEMKSLIDKGKRQAEKYERYNELIEFYKWERKFLVNKLKPEKSKKALRLIQDKVQQLMDIAQFVFEVDAVRDNFIFYLHKQHKYLSEEELSEVKKIFKRHSEEMKRLDRQPLPFVSRKTLYETYLLYYILVSDYPTGLKWSKKLVGLMEEYPLLAMEEPDFYAKVLYNHSAILHNNNRKEEALLVSERLKGIIKKSPFTSRSKTGYYILLSRLLDFSFYTNLGRLKEASEAVKDIESGLKIYETMLSRPKVTLIHYNFAFFNLLIGNYTKAAREVDLLSETKLEGSFAHLLRSGQLVGLMIHFEKGNIELLEYRSKSALRYLQKRFKIYSFEKTFLDYMIKISKTSTKAEQQKLFKELKELLLKNSKEWEMIDEQELIPWIDSKINGTTFEEEYLKKLKANGVLNK